MPITITYRQIIIGILLLVLSYGSVATESNTLIKDISFNRGENGEGIITISLPNQNIAPSISDRQGKIIVNLPNTELSELLQKEINVAESKTPVQTINASTNNQNTNISISPKGHYAYSAYQLNDSLVITLWKTVEQPKASIESNDQLKSNDDLSLNLPDAEIRTILKTIADYKKMYLVMSDSVTGKMTLRMNNVPWEQSLDIVLKSNNLAKRLEGKILVIAPTEELLAFSRKLLDEQVELCNIRPKPRKLFPIKYTDAKTIIEMFTQQKSIDEQNDTSSLAVDKRTNTIIAYQTPENLALLDKIIKEHDIPITLVQLEARVFEVNKNYITFIKTQLSQGKLVDILLNKMQKEGWGEVISQPKVITPNKEEVRIVKGQEICCYPNISACAHSSQATLSFTITPEVINNSQLKLSIEIYMEPVENQNKASPVKKQFEKIVNDNQTIILDKLDDLEYPLKNSSQSQLMIIITPRIIAPKL